MKIYIISARFEGIGSSFDSFKKAKNDTESHFFSSGPLWQDSFDTKADKIELFLRESELIDPFMDELDRINVHRDETALNHLIEKIYTTPELAPVQNKINEEGEKGTSYLLEGATGSKLIIGTASPSALSIEETNVFYHQMISSQFSKEQISQIDSLNILAHRTDMICSNNDYRKGIFFDGKMDAHLKNFPVWKAKTFSHMQNEPEHEFIIRIMEKGSFSADAQAYFDNLLDQNLFTL